MKKFNFYKKIASEIIFGIFQVLGSSLETKIGLAIFLLIPGVAIFFLDVSKEENPWIFYVIGAILIIGATILFISEIKSLKKDRKKFYN